MRNNHRTKTKTCDPGESFIRCLNFFFMKFTTSVLICRSLQRQGWKPAEPMSYDGADFKRKCVAQLSRTTGNIHYFKASNISVYWSRLCFKERLYQRRPVSTKPYVSALWLYWLLVRLWKICNREKTNIAFNANVIYDKISVCQKLSTKQKFMLSFAD